MFCGLAAKRAKASWRRYKALAFILPGPHSANQHPFDIRRTAWRFDNVKNSTPFGLPVFTRVHPEARHHHDFRPHIGGFGRNGGHHILVVAAVDVLVAKNDPDPISFRDITALLDIRDANRIDSQARKRASDSLPAFQIRRHNNDSAGFAHWPPNSFKYNTGDYIGGTLDFSIG